MLDLPTGTVTFLFTDVEGSTKLLEEIGDAAYSQVLAEHHRLCREVWAEHGGVEVDMAGDAFFVAFTRASNALTAAAAAQEALSAEPLRVRMGLHTGQVLVGETGYVGMEVHRAARIAASAHGGQVILSRATAELVELNLTDLGEHRFKDLAAPERVYQLGEGDFPRAQVALPDEPTHPRLLLPRARAGALRARGASHPRGGAPHHAYRPGRHGEDPGCPAGGGRGLRCVSGRGLVGRARPSS